MERFEGGRWEDKTVQLLLWSRGKQFGDSSKRERGIILGSSSSTPRYTPRRTKTSYSNKCLHTSVHRSINYKLPEDPWVKEWMNELWYIHMVEY